MWIYNEHAILNFTDTTNIRYYKMVLDQVRASGFFWALSRMNQRGREFLARSPGRVHGTQPIASSYIGPCFKLHASTNNLK